jgi:hypothetical protein
MGWPLFYTTWLYILILLLNNLFGGKHDQAGLIFCQVTITILVMGFNEIYMWKNHNRYFLPGEIYWTSYLFFPVKKPAYNFA